MTFGRMKTRGGIAALALAFALGGGTAAGLGHLQSLEGTTSLTSPAHAQSVTPRGDREFTGNGLPSSFAPIIERVAPAVVNIQVTHRSDGRETGRGEMDLPPGMRDFMERFFGEDFSRRFGAPEGRERFRPPRVGVGSGFVVDSDGYIVTNNHVVEQAENIVVTFEDGTKRDAELIGTDPKTDLALIKVESRGDLPFVEFGDSDTADVGDWVLAIGSPFGLGHSVTAGIVSARGRQIGSGPYDDFLQVDAPINRGNSGGPTFNIGGEVVGVNTAIFSPTGGSVGIGFAIPSNMARDVVDQLRDRGYVERGWLGVTIQTVTEDIAAGLDLPKAEGAIVAQVSSGSPADEAGLRQGDVIVEVDGTAIDAMRELPRVVAGIRPGSTANLTIWRDGERISREVRIGSMPGDDEAAAAQVEPETNGEMTYGLELGRLDEDARRKFDVPSSVTEGVIVLDVDPASPAAEKGLRPGDVILKVANTDVATPSDVREQVARARAADVRAVLLLVSRGGDQRFVGLPLAG